MTYFASKASKQVAIRLLQPNRSIDRDRIDIVALILSNASLQLRNPISSDIGLHLLELSPFVRRFKEFLI